MVTLLSSAHPCRCIPKLPLALLVLGSFLSSIQAGESGSEGRTVEGMAEQLVRPLLDAGARGCEAATRRKEGSDFLWNLPGVFESIRFQRLDTMLHTLLGDRTVGPGVTLQQGHVTSVSGADIQCRFALYQRNSTEDEFPIRICGQMSLTKSGEVAFHLDDFVPCFALNNHPFPSNLPFLWMGTDGTTLRWFSDYDQGRPLQEYRLKARQVSDGFFSLMGTYGIRESAEAYHLLVYKRLRDPHPVAQHEPKPDLDLDDGRRVKRFRRALADGQVVVTADVTWNEDRVQRIDWWFAPVSVSVRNEAFAYDIELSENGRTTEQRHVIPVLTTEFPQTIRRAVVQFSHHPDVGTYPKSITVMTDAREVVGEIAVTGWCETSRCMPYREADEDAFQRWNEDHVIWSLAQGAVYRPSGAQQQSMLSAFLDDSRSRVENGSADLVRIRVYCQVALREYEQAVAELKAHGVRLRKAGLWEMDALEQEAALRWAWRHNWVPLVTGLLGNLEIAYRSPDKSITLANWTGRLLSRQQVGLALHCRNVIRCTGGELPLEDEGKLWSAVIRMYETHAGPEDGKKSACDRFVIERCRDTAGLAELLQSTVSRLRGSGQPALEKLAGAVESLGVQLTPRQTEPKPHAP